MSNPIVDDLGASYIIEWYHERRIVLVALGDSQHGSIDRVYEFLVKLIDTWPMNRPYLSIYDATRSRFSFTPYLRQKARDLMRHAAHKQGRSAVLLPHNLLGQVIRLSVKMDLIPLAGVRDIRIFFDRAEALDWLLEFPEHGITIDTK